ncbi:GBP-domain-containing protein [Rhizophagus irregularis]|nr:GBP-domain-containing protein [Rhizophagus irregularis]
MTRPFNSLSDIEGIKPIDSTKDGNRFGRGIEFREGALIKLLSYSEKSVNGKFGQILLNPEALNILQEINEPLAIISVVGSFHRGKSWFANVLHGRHDSFNLGPGVEGCTRGIYMWSPPFKLSNEQSDSKTIQKRVIVLDSEGIDDPNQDPNWATKLFILCLVISSTFVYNINRIVGNIDIGKLCLMTNLNEFIQEPKDGDFLLRLVILLRDFIFESPETAMAIERIFSDFDVYSLPPPGCKKKLLQHMEEVKNDELDEDFVNEVENAIKSIFSQLPIKYIGSSTMQGISFVKFLENTIERMNSSEVSSLLSIPSEYESVIQFVAQEAIKESIEKYKERMNALINEGGKLPILWKKSSNFTEQLGKEMCKFKEELAVRNSKELTIYNENIAKELWIEYVEIGLYSNENNSFKNAEDLQYALKLFESNYNKSMKESPEADKIITSYKTNQYSAAIDYMARLGRINKELAKTMYTREVAHRKQLEASAREEALRIEIELWSREREEYEKNIEIKTLELQANIRQQKQLHHEEEKGSNKIKENLWVCIKNHIRKILSPCKH